MGSAFDVFSRKSRIVAGLMSGTSLDGVDCVIVRLEGSGPGLSFEILGSAMLPFPQELRKALLANSTPHTSSVREISQLNALLPELYAQAVNASLESAGISSEDLDLIGSHGQTLHHVPEPEDCAGVLVRSTFQIGDIAVLATLTNTPVVGDFRMADMALGGQGAPLVPYLDYVLFSDPTESRGLLNIGGISNITILPKGRSSESVIAFDTGPGNMIIDSLARHFLDRDCDLNGDCARNGEVHSPLLEELMSDSFFGQEPPKSTGRERYGVQFIEKYLVKYSRLPVSNWLATVTELTARSVFQAYDQFIRTSVTIDRLLVSGGGSHNAHLMSRLADYFGPVPVQDTDEFGVDSDLKEALCFAVLAHEWANGTRTGLPSVTGATDAGLLGKLALPPNPRP